MSGYNVRSGYDLGSVEGTMAVAAGNEPVSLTCSASGDRPPDVPGFVVGHHHGHVTVDVFRRIHCEVGVDDAYRLGLQLMWAADLARLGGAGEAA